MLNIILLMASALFVFQSTSSTFYVRDVDVLTEYDSRYVLERVGLIIPPEKSVEQKDIDCLVNELKASGIFEDVKVELTPAAGGERKLTLTCVYPGRIRAITISKVEIEGIPEADKAKFGAGLSKRGVVPGTPLMKYYFRSLEERINAALRASLPDKMAADFSGSAWLTIRPDGKEKVKLIVSPGYAGCDAGSSYSQPLFGKAPPLPISVRNVQAKRKN